MKRFSKIVSDRQTYSYLLTDKVIHRGAPLLETLL